MTGHYQLYFNNATEESYVICASTFERPEIAIIGESCALVDIFVEFLTKMRPEGQVSVHHFFLSFVLSFFDEKL